MNTTTCASEAAAVVASKAKRLFAAAATGKQGADEKRRQADVLQRIAALVAAGADALVVGLPDTSTITPHDRRTAANEVYALAMRREARGTARQFGAPLQPGWTPSGSDAGPPIHRPTLREAAELYDLALALSNVEYWAYQKGLLLERLGEYTAAVRTFDGLAGDYAKHGAQQAERCRRKLGDNPTPTEAQLTPDAHEPLPPLDADPLELAAAAAQQFAEHLADGDYLAATAMLSTDLATTTAHTLQNEFEQMIEYGVKDGESLEICVMSSEGDMPDMTPADLGWVYVAISGESFNEAVTVVVTRENGDAKIRELEWGRP